MYATITDDLYDFVRLTINTAYTLWTWLYTFFCDSQLGCAINIGLKFYAAIQGDPTTAAYYRKLKSLTSLTRLQQITHAPYDLRSQPPLLDHDH